MGVRRVTAVVSGFIQGSVESVIKPGSTSTSPAVVLLSPPSLPPRPTYLLSPRMVKEYDGDNDGDGYIRTDFLLQSGQA